MRNRNRVRAIAASVLAVTVLLPLVPASPFAPDAQAVTLPSGLQTGFQIDGNKTAASPPNTFDWDDFLTPPQPDGSFTFTPTGPYTTATGATSSGVTQGAFYWDNGSLDAACANAREPTGQPGNQNPDTNPWVPGSAIPNDKGNLCSAGYAVEAVMAPDGQRHTILYAYWTRRTDNSSVSVYELFEGPLPGRCDDLLLEAQFPSGSTNFQTWTPAAGDDCANPLGAGTWGPAGRTIDFAFAMGQRTEGPAAPGQQVNTFAEYAIDLTAAGLFPDTTCSTYTVSQRFSRTGTAASAVIHDFFLNTPNPLEISNCGTLTVTKQITSPGSTDDEFRFTVSSDEGPILLGPPPIEQIVGSVRPGQTLTFTGVRAGTQTHIDETGIPEPWVKQSIICSFRDFAGVMQTVDVTEPATPFPIIDGGRTDCVITNNAALVTVTKQTDPDGVPGSFTFDVGGRTVELSDGESETIAFAPGTEVTITEDAVEGWLAPIISCTTDPVETTERSVTITAQLGQTIECTFTNTQLGTVIITKEAHGVDGRTFQFEGTFPGAQDGFGVFVEFGDGTLYNTTFPNIPPGTYTVTEFEDTEDPPTVVSDVACTFGGADVSFPPEDRTATFTVLPGETVRCFFTNSVPQQIFVIKRTLPVEFNQQFEFTVDPPVAESPFILNGNSDGPPAGALWSSPPLEPGEYTVTETPQPNWTLDDITCTADEDLWEADLSAGEVTIDLPPDQTVTCFFTNLATPAQATVTKTVEGIAGSLPWAFDVAISPDTGVAPGPAQRLTGTGPGSASVTWNNLVPGQQYTISETQQDGWEMGELTCTDPANLALTDLDLQPLTFTFVAGVGQQLACTMTNTGIPSQVELTKITSGIAFDFPWRFDFAIDPLPTGEISPKSANGIGQTSDVLGWTNLLPGQTYTITELGELAGITTGLTCDGGPTRSIGASFQFTAPLDGSVNCTATNIVDPVPAQITKTTEGGDGTFTFTLSPPPETGQDPQIVEITTSGGTGTGEFVGLVPGQIYSLTETDDPAWQRSGLTCTVTPLEGEPFEIPDLTAFTVDIGDSVACSATNTLIADSVSVTKVVEGVADDFEWSFQLTLTPESGEALTEVASGVGNTSDLVSWADLDPGTYSLSEVLPDGWNPAVIICMSGQTTVDPDALVIDGTQAYTCTITNSPVPGEITVTKSVDGVAPGFDWAFEVGIAPVPAGQPENVNLTNADPEHTWTNLTPGTVYTLTESVPAGWTAEIQCGDAPPGDPTAGHAVLIQPGGSVACSIVNTATPGSGAITKTAVGGDNSFDFVLRPLPDGEPTTITVTTEAGSGSAALPELVPGVVYSLAEVDLPDWIEGELVCEATPAGGGEARELDVDSFVVEPGDALTCSVRNEPVEPSPTPTEPTPTPPEPSPTVPEPSPTVPEPSPTPPDMEMPATGTDLVRIVGLALALLAFGAALFGASRARRRREA